MEQNFELNKQAFGAFLAQLRREKGWTRTRQSVNGSGA